MTTVTIPNELMDEVKKEFDINHPYMELSKTKIIINILSEYIKIDKNESKK